MMTKYVALASAAVLIQGCMKAGDIVPDPSGLTALDEQILELQPSSGDDAVALIANCPASIAKAFRGALLTTLGGSAASESHSKFNAAYSPARPIADMCCDEIRFAQIVREKGVWEIDWTSDPEKNPGSIPSPWYPVQTFWTNGAPAPQGLRAAMTDDPGGHYWTIAKVGAFFGSAINLKFETCAVCSAGKVPWMTNRIYGCASWEIDYTLKTNLRDLNGIRTNWVNPATGGTMPYRRSTMINPPSATFKTLTGFKDLQD